MKVEFLVALTDHTWYTKVVDIPKGEVPENVDDPTFDGEVHRWALENIRQFEGDIAIITVYCID